MTIFHCLFVLLNDGNLLDQKIVATVKWLLLVVTLVVILMAAAYFGYKGLMWLSDWMNEVEERQQSQRRRYP